MQASRIQQVKPQVSSSQEQLCFAVGMGPKAGDDWKLGRKVSRLCRVVDEATHCW